MNYYSKLAFIIASFFILYACTEKLEDKIAKGGKKYGGEISFVETEKASSFFPLYSYGLHDQRQPAIPAIVIIYSM